MTARRSLRTLLHYKWLIGAMLAALAAAIVPIAGRSTTVAVVPAASERDVTVWAPPDSRPLSDAAAAALVTRQLENRPRNAAANDYVPTSAQLAAFHSAQQLTRRFNDFNPLTRYVTGRPGMRHPSTDDLVQWASHKWGIPTNWIRAQVAVESNWDQAQLGDRAAVSSARYRAYPGRSRVAGTDLVYESLGIAQVKWLPSESVGVGTEPLRWESTAFNLDYYAAMIRFYYDGYCLWAAPGYRAGEAWSSIGAWYSPNPWNNAGARDYIRMVQAALAERAWTRPGF